MNETSKHGKVPAGHSITTDHEEESNSMLQNYDRHETNPGRTEKLQTLWVCLCVASCGMCVGLRGPTLLDLQRFTRSSFTHISIAVFTSMAAGWTIGGITGGALIDKWNKNIMMGLFGIGSGVFTLSVPWSAHIEVMACIIAVSGACISAYEAGAFTLCFGLWGAAAGPYSQLLVMLFSLGNFIAPLFVEAFLKLSQKNSFYLNATEISGVQSPNTSSKLYNLVNITLKTNAINESDDFYYGATKVTDTLNCGEPAGSIQFNQLYWCAYITIGIITILSASPFFINACLSIKTSTSNNNNDTAQSQPRKKYFFIKILTLLVIFSFLNTGIEEILGGFFKVFAIKQLCWTDSQGNLIVSLYWGVFTFAKLIGAIEALYLHPSIIIILHLCILVASICSLLLVNIWQIWLWISCVIIGIFMSPIWPARLAWTDKYIKLSGKLIGLIFVTEGVASMIWPSLIGFLMDTFGPMCFVYVLMILVSFTLTVFIGMHCIAKHYGERFEVNA